MVFGLDGYNRIKPICRNTLISGSVSLTESVALYKTQTTKTVAIEETACDMWSVNWFLMKVPPHCESFPTPSLRKISLAFI